MDDILSQIIAYAPDKIDTELKAAALVQGSRNMDQEPRNMADGGRLSFKIGLTSTMQERIKNFESKTKEKYLEQNNQKKKDIRDGKWKGTGKGSFFTKRKC